jgi:hypothetical protein
MRFKPYGDEWFRLRTPQNPDEAERSFLHNEGEFSLYKDEAFERHLERYERLNKFYAHQNGKRLKLVVKGEKPWYGRQGMEEIIK